MDAGHHRGCGEFTLPFLSGGRFLAWGTPDPLGRVASWRRWFGVSDIGGFLSGVTTGISCDVLLAIGLFVLSGYVLWRTPFGLRLRSAGERPSAADSLGVNVLPYAVALIVVASRGQSLRPPAEEGQPWFKGQQ